MSANPTDGVLFIRKFDKASQRKKQFACGQLDSRCRITVAHTSSDSFRFPREFSIVIHYSCDRCKREIDHSTDLRYTVTIEIEAALDGPDHELVDDPDHLDDIQDMLNSADELCSSVFDDEVYQRKQFDLCKDCFRQYIKNPLSRESTTPMGFSKN